MRCPRALSRTTVAAAALAALTGCMTVGAPGDDHKQAPVGNSSVPDPGGTDEVGNWGAEQPRAASDGPGRLSGWAASESSSARGRPSASPEPGERRRPSASPTLPGRSERPGDPEPSRRPQPSGPDPEPSRSDPPPPETSQPPDPEPSDPPPPSPQDPPDPVEGDG